MRGVLFSKFSPRSNFWMKLYQTTELEELSCFRIVSAPNSLCGAQKRPQKISLPYMVSLGGRLRRPPDGGPHVVGGWFSLYVFSPVLRIGDGIKIAEKSKKKRKNARPCLFLPKICGSLPKNQRSAHASLFENRSPDFPRTTETEAGTLPGHLSRRESVENASQQPAERPQSIERRQLVPIFFHDIF